jgi:uncharacterized protein
MHALSPTVSTGVWNPKSLDIRAFAQANAVMTQDTPLKDFDRLAQEALEGDWGHVRWRIQGQLRPSMVDGQSTHWVHVMAHAALGLTCQRCLSCTVSPLAVDRWFRFVATEPQAAVEDEISEEDVLAWEPRPDLLQLVEDELLMVIPTVPMHDTCPTPLSVEGGSIETPTEGRPHPFAVLAQLKQGN